MSAKRLEELGQIGRLREMDRENRLDCRTKRKYEGLRPKVLQVPDSPDQIRLPVAFWDQESGTGVAAWLMVSLGRVPEVSWMSRFGSEACRALEKAGKAAAELLHERSHIHVDFFLPLVHVGLFCPTGDPLPVDGFPVDGESLGAAFAVAWYWLAADLPNPGSVRILGALSEDHRLKTVGHVDAKMNAWERECFPEGPTLVVGGDAPGVIRISESAGLGEIVDRIWPGEIPHRPLHPDILASDIEAMIPQLEKLEDAESLDLLAKGLTPSAAHGGLSRERHLFLLSRARGSVANSRGKATEALVLLEETARDASRLLRRSLVDELDCCTLFSSLAVMYTDLHRWREADQWLLRARKVAGRMRGWSGRLSQAHILATEGQALMFSGRARRAVPVLRKALRKSETGRNQVYLAASLILACRQGGGMGAPGAARRLAEAGRLLDRVRTHWRPESASERIRTSQFAMYWEMRLAFELGRPPVLAVSDLNQWKGEMERSPYPLGLVFIWRALAARRAGGGSSGDEAALGGLAVLVSSRQELLVLLALGLSARLLATGFEPSAVVGVLGLDAGKVRESGVLWDSCACRVWAHWACEVLDGLTPGLDGFDEDRNILAHWPPDDPAEWLTKLADHIGY